MLKMYDVLNVPALAEGVKSNGFPRACYYLVVMLVVPVATHWQVGEFPVPIAF